MSGYETRLADLGVTLPDAPAPAANYVPSWHWGDLVFVSGQISMRDGAFITGKLGADMDVEDGAAAARTCAIGLLAQLKAACGGDLDRLQRVVKLTGFVNSDRRFHRPAARWSTALPTSSSRCSATGRHTRSAVSAASLPVRRRGRDRGRSSRSPDHACPTRFLRAPLAHRALHDTAAGRARKLPRGDRGRGASTATASRSTCSPRPTAGRWSSTTTRWTG